MFGVDWEVIIGHQGLSYKEEEAYANGPFCPNDHYKLDVIYEPSLFGSPKAIWRCGSCGAMYPDFDS